MEQYFYIYTQNRFNQVLIFDSYEDAEKWCKSATRWTDEEIKKNIKTPTTYQTGFCSIFDL